MKINRKSLVFIKIAFLSFALVSCFSGGDIVSNLELVAGQKIGTVNGTLSEARFTLPYGITTDAENNLYVSEPRNQIIRKISSSGTVSTYAGIEYQTGANDGHRTNATFMMPTAMVYDKTRQILYVLDSGNGVIRAINSSGLVSTLTEQLGISDSRDGSNIQALPNSTTLVDALVIDSRGNLYLSNSIVNIILKITPEGDVSTFAGKRSQAGSINGSLNEATFNQTNKLIVDSNDNILVFTKENIRKISSTGNITTLLTAETQIERNFLETETYVTVDINDNVYTVATSNNKDIAILKMTPFGEISIFSEIPTEKDSSNIMSGLHLTADSLGNIFFADFTNTVIRKFQPNGIMLNLGKTNIGSVDSINGLDAQFALPASFDIDLNGDIVISDTENNSLRKVTMRNQIPVSTFSGAASYSKSGFINSSAIDSRFKYPSSISFNALNNSYYVVDQYGTIVRKIEPDGTTSTLAGGFNQPYQDGIGVSSSFNRISGMTLNSDKTHLFVVDSNRIRTIDMSGLVTTIVGENDKNIISSNGKIVADSLNNAYVVDSGLLKKITPTGQVSTVFEDIKPPTFMDTSGFKQTLFNMLGYSIPQISLHSVMAIDDHGEFYLQFCAAAEGNIIVECDLRKFNATNNTLTPTGIKTNWAISDLKFDKNGQAFALLGGGLYKASFN